MVSVLGDHYYNFPQKLGNTRKLRDLLEDNVSESYYLSERLLQFFIKHTEECKEKGQGFAFTPTHGDGVARTVQAGSNRMDDNYIIGCIVSEQGKKLEKTTDIAVCLTARDYKGFGNQAMTGVLVWKKK